ncbi:hypothetical protein [Ideonella paludis]|uniref:hypothetical protein n=1 Tax=Ideonella paludis TaxID=1233411 RepID=UPI003640E150
MNRFWTIVLDPRVLVVIGLAALAAFLFIGADVLAVAGFWAALGLALILLVWLIVWVVKRVRAKRAAKALEQAIDQQGALGLPALKTRLSWPCCASACKRRSRR